jgi:hypothetical protein
VELTPQKPRAERQGVGARRVAAHPCGLFEVLKRFRDLLA